MAVLYAGVKDKAREVLKTVSSFGTTRAVYLFGSHMDGSADEWSDVDIAVFMEGVEDWDLQQRTQAMVRVMEEVGDDIETHLFPASSLEHPIRGSFAAYILKHGVQILDLRDSQIDERSS